MYSHVPNSSGLFSFLFVYDISKASLLSCASSCMAETYGLPARY